MLGSQVHSSPSRVYGASWAKEDMLDHCFYLIGLFVLLKPESIAYLSQTANSLWNIARLAVEGIVLILFLTSLSEFKRNRGANAMFTAILFYSCTLGISTGLSKYGSIGSWLQETVHLIGAFMLFTLVFTRVRRPLSMLVEVYALYVLMNLVTIALFPKGMYAQALTGFGYNWFLGTRNVFITYVLPLTMFVILKYQAFDSDRVVDVSKCLRIAIVILGALSCIMLGSATSTVALCIVGLGMLIPRARQGKRPFTPFGYFIIVVIMFVTIVMLKSLAGFSWIIEQMLGKSLSLSGRTDLWSRMNDLISSGPVMGYGVMTGEDIVLLTGRADYINSHDMYLWSLFRGGYTGLVFFMFIVGVALAELTINRKAPGASIVSLGVFVVLVMWLVECVSLRAVLPLLLVSCYLQDPSSKTSSVY